MKTCTNNNTMTASQFASDALGRRIGKYDAAAMETTFYYYNDQWQILAEYTADTTCRQWYTYGNYIDEVLSVNTHPTLMIAMRYYAHDHLSSPAALANVNGFTVWERYEYDAYGKVTITARGADNLWYTADDVTLSASAYHNPFTFTGRQLDILDSGNLHHMHYRFRDYSPQLGQFFQHDPLGLIALNKGTNFLFQTGQYFSGINLYSYVLNQPIITIDPLGLVGLDCPAGEVSKMKQGYVPDKNGCGSGSTHYIVPDNLFGVNFGVGCNEHDECYQDCSKSQAECDDAFKTDLRVLCNLRFSDQSMFGYPGQYNVMLQLCYAAAETYFVAVSSPLGTNAHTSAQNKACECVPDCGSSTSPSPSPTPKPPQRPDPPKRPFPIPRIPRDWPRNIYL